MADLQDTAGLRTFYTATSWFKGDPLLHVVCFSESIPGCLPILVVLRSLQGHSQLDITYQSPPPIHLVVHHEVLDHKTTAVIRLFSSALAVTLAPGDSYKDLPGHTITHNDPHNIISYIDPKHGQPTHSLGTI